MIYSIMGFCGLAGGILCCISDILLDLKGPENEKLGEYKVINSAWDHMDMKRFRTSITVASVAIPLYGLESLSLAFQMDEAAPRGWCLLFKLAIYAGMVGIYAGWLNLSGWWLLITPFPMIAYGAILKKINSIRFCDLPSIFLPCLGMGMFGLLVMIN